MSASLSDILTAAKNIVTAINNAAQIYLNVNGTSSQTAITSASLVKTGQGRIATISVIVAGTTAGAVYDITTPTALSNQIGVIPNMIGPFVFNIPFSNGLVVVPGSGQTITVAYS